MRTIKWDGMKLCMLVGLLLPMYHLRFFKTDGLVSETYAKARKRVHEN